MSESEEFKIRFQSLTFKYFSKFQGAVITDKH